MMDFNLNKVPFSRSGSYFAFNDRSSDGDSSNVVLRSIHGAFHVAGTTDLFRIDLFRQGRPVAYAAKVTPARLILDFDEGSVEIVFMNAKCLRFRSRNVEMRLTYLAPHMSSLPTLGASLEIDILDLRLLVTPAEGLLKASQEEDGSGYLQLTLDEQSGDGDFVLREFQGDVEEAESIGTFDEGVTTVEADFQRWMDSVPSVPDHFAGARSLAGYVNWSAIVAPEGHFKRPAMLMSKNWMLNVWSWDHCFNAMALIYADPAAAWDQFMLLFDLQRDDGMLPDCVNDRHLIWDFCKPPIHGWALRWMMERSKAIDETKLTEIYEPLCRWTEWWFKYRDDDHDGMPQYNHGNDSGWDNGTMFIVGPPIEGPDLGAFLILQMETLAIVARRLGKIDESARWSDRSSRMLKLTLDHCWVDGRFVAPRSGDHARYESDSLLLLIPIILGNGLPADIQRSLIDRLTEPGAYLTRFGLASEHLGSPHYRSDGYWRGPIWAPATMLVVSGLMEAGEEALAREIAKRFCDLCDQSGFAENFDAVTGEGRSDPAYTWTSSIFLILAHEYLPTNP